MNPDDNIIRAIDMRIDQRLKKTFFAGVVVSASKGYAQVQIVGSTALQYAYYTPGVIAEPGTRCLLAYVPTFNQIVIVTTFGSAGGATPRLPPNIELSPPSGLTSQPILPDVALATWNAPYQHGVLFEVQSNDTATSAGATTILYTRGSYVMIPTETNVFVRVRSISQHPSYSSWTDWVELEPGEGGEGGGSGDVDADDVSYTPTTPGDWNSAPTEVESALDELASRAEATESALASIDLNDLADVVVTSPSNTQFLMYTAGVWTPQTITTDFVNYTAANSGDWIGTPPTKAGSALDQLAGRVDDLEDGGGSGGGSVDMLQVILHTQVFG